MAYLVVMVENQLADAYEAIDALADRGVLGVVESTVLKSLYAAGWDDGFVAGHFEEMSERFGLSASAFITALTALEHHGATRLRPLASGECSVELLTLSQAVSSNGARLGWWRYYFVVDADGGIGEGSSDAA